eukprot:7511699-Alexandrium_andersonii.AAC.1
MCIRDRRRTPGARPPGVELEAVLVAERFRFRMHAAVVHALASHAPIAKDCADCRLQDRDLERSAPRLR